MTASTLNNEKVELSWEEPAQTGGSPVQKYRIFVSEKDVSGSRLEINTNNARTTYELKTPKAMHGKDYIFTVQAINRNQKMSLVSDMAIFHVANPEAEVAAAPSSSRNSSVRQTAAPITFLEATAATPEEITLVWSEVSDASDYKLKWDKGDQQESSLFYSLVASTNGANTIKIDRTNSGGIMGT